MTPAERAAKIAELRAEIDRLEREGKLNWPERITAGMLFRHHANGMYVTCFPDGSGRLVLVQIDSQDKDWMNGTHSGFRGFGEQEEGFTYLGYACDLLTIKAPDAPEPTGAELVGEVCEFSDPIARWTEPYKCMAYDPAKGYLCECEGALWMKRARLYREDRP